MSLSHLISITGIIKSEVWWRSHWYKSFISHISHLLLYKSSSYVDLPQGSTEYQKKVLIILICKYNVWLRKTQKGALSLILRRWCTSGKVGFKLKRSGVSCGLRGLLRAGPGPAGGEAGEGLKALVAPLFWQLAMLAMRPEEANTGHATHCDIGRQTGNRHQALMQY